MKQREERDEKRKNPLQEEDRLPSAAAQFAWTSVFGESMSRNSTPQILVPSMRTFTWSEVNAQNSQSSFQTVKK